MNIDYFFRHMATSPALMEYTDGKMRESLHGYRGEPLTLRVTFEVEHNDNIASARVVGQDGYHVEAKCTADNMYEAVNQLVQKIERQMLKHKGKVLDHSVEAPKDIESIATPVELGE